MSAVLRGLVLVLAVAILASCFYGESNTPRSITAYGGG